MTLDDYKRAIALAIERCPEAREELEALLAWLPDALAQRAAGQAPLGDHPEKAGGTGRARVIITRCGTRLLDADNGAGGCKALLDACRYENLIPNDDPSCIEFEFRQRKVRRKDIGTEILIVAI